MQQRLNLRDCKAGLLRKLHHAQHLHGALIVTPAAIHPVGPGHQSDALIVTQRGWSNASLPRYFANRQIFHNIPA